MLSPLPLSWYSSPAVQGLDQVNPAAEDAYARLCSGALDLLQHQLGYSPAVPGYQAGAFHWAVHMTQRTGGTASDAVIAFMIIELGNLGWPLQGQAQVFYTEKIEHLKRVAQASIDGQLLMELFLQDSPQREPSGIMFKIWQAEAIKHEPIRHRSRASRLNKSRPHHAGQRLPAVHPV